ncbi:MAG: ABC transporter ATP-binding protein [candidate division Zixibacteria bacterium]|nr:ABC transporter ATP-binding protein [candidate division Zixibacteria bacterium]
MELTLTAKDIYKAFNRNAVLNRINFNVSGREGLIITGPNGSGKSTLLKILCNLLKPSSGEIVFSIQNKPISMDKVRINIGLVAPDINLYEEMSAVENIIFFSRLKGMNNAELNFHTLFSEHGLSGRGEELVKTFSSGMKQRLKYIIATLNNPPFLFLDEPTANLDQNGKEMVKKVCENQKSNGVLVIATNEQEDFQYGTKIVRLDGDGIGNPA